MLIATDGAVFALHTHADTPHALFEGPVRQVVEGRTCIVVALTDNSLVVLRDGEHARWASGVEGSIESLLILAEEPLRVLVGAEPPYVYHVAEGEAATRDEQFAALECRKDWYTPWGGPAAVRSLAYTPDGHVYADIHVGSIMCSGDGGETWAPVTPTLHVDVHQVAVCPAAPARVYANTAAAVYVSEDHGQSWAHRAGDLDAKYGRALAVHPREPDVILATISDGPHGDNVHGELWRSVDAGVSWQQCVHGFPAATHANIDTFHVVFDEHGTAWAVVEDDLYASDDRGATWRKNWTAPSTIGVVTSRSSQPGE